jgi:hypothetical protein
MMLVTRQDKIGSNPVYIPGIFMMLIIIKLVLYIDDDVQTAQSADGQTENIDKAESPVPYQEPISRFEIAFEHAGLLALTASKKMPLFYITGNQ